MSFFFPVARLIDNVVQENESRQREILFISGVSPWVHLSYWCVSALLTFLVVTLLVTGTLSAQVLQHSSFGLLLLWVGLFATSLVGFCFVIAALCQQSSTAAVVGPMAILATLLPRYIFFGIDHQESSPHKSWASLFPATAFCFGADIIADYDVARIGVNSGNVRDGEYSFQTVLLFLLLDTLIYLILASYLDQVMPRAIGRRKSLFFLFSPRY